MSYIKRTFDVLIAGLGIILICPVFLVIALFVRLLHGAPVLFRQTRPGLLGAPFKIYKFRTMTDESDTSGKPVSEAQRLTSLGTFLRSTSLDELPELFNVLRGDMSLVGPRPLLMEYMPLYSPRQARRHEVRPGITGWAQVNGRNAISWEEKFELDVWYIDHWSFLLDIRILFMTLAGIPGRKGINQPGHATAEKFKGKEIK